MIYTDTIHLVADTFEELHDFAKKIGLKRNYYHGVKGYPHYNLINGMILTKALKNGAKCISEEELLLISKNCKNGNSIKN